MTLREKKIVDPLSEKQYIESFASLYQPFENNRSTESQVRAQWTKDYLKTYASPDSILSIGAGTGTYDAFLINQLSAPPQYYCGVEPTPGHEKILQRNIANLKSPPRNISIISRPFDQDFQLIGSECKHFDLIVMAHCLYCIPNQAEAIKHATQFLNDDGRIVIYNGCFEGVTEVFTKFVHEFNLTWTTYPIQDQTVTIETISNDLRAMNIRHSMERFNSFIDVTSFFEDDRPTVINILNFMMQTDVTKFPEYYLQEMIDYVKGYSKFNQKSGWYEFYKPSGFIVVPKPGQIKVDHTTKPDIVEKDSTRLQEYITWVAERQVSEKLLLQEFFQGYLKPHLESGNQVISRVLNGNGLTSEAQKQELSALQNIVNDLAEIGEQIESYDLRVDSLNEEH